jgi:hypothetical protein
MFGESMMTRKVVTFRCAHERVKYQRSKGVTFARDDWWTEGGLMGWNPAFQMSTGGSTTRFNDIREDDVGDEKVGWTMGLAAIGAWQVDQSRHVVYAANDYVFDEHDLDTLDFVDQFGRPRLADGSLPPISVYVHIVLVDLDTMEVLDDDEQRWVDSGRRVGWQEWTPECVPLDQTRRGSIDDNDLYAMTAQRKPLGETDDDGDVESQEEPSND